jgi:orotate phosphoribosyltransferase
MRQEEISRLLTTTGAIRQGHFELSSGLHSGTYVQCALVLQYPIFAEMLGRALATEFHDLRVDCVASPALGGVILGQEVARALSTSRMGTTPPGTSGVTANAGGTRAIFVERDSRGTLLLRRGFQVEQDEHVLVVEDVWTTGGSTFETIRVIEEAGGRVIAVGALIDRSGGAIEFPVRAEALLDLKIDSFEVDDCPLCRSGSAVTRPGSRFRRNTP